MPLRPNVMKLPARLRRELDARLKKSNFGDLEEHAAWLKSRGHPIGKSALGVYVLEHPARLAQSYEGMTADARRLHLKLSDQRVELLKLAVPLGAKTAAQAKKVAEDLERWARSGR